MDEMEDQGIEKQLDEIDDKITGILYEEGFVQTSEIAKKLSFPIVEATQRMMKMKELRLVGIIELTHHLEES